MQALMCLTRVPTVPQGWTWSLSEVPSSDWTQSLFQVLFLHHACVYLITPARHQPSGDGALAGALPSGTFLKFIIQFYLVGSCSSIEAFSSLLMPEDPC